MDPALKRDIESVVAAARRAGRGFLVETEAYIVLEELGIPVPRHHLVAGPEDVGSVDPDAFSGDRVVVKVIAPGILHRSDVGGVVVVDRDRAAISRAIETMHRRFVGQDVIGYAVNQFVEFDRGLGGELLLGIRWTHEFGAVVTLGLGGIHAEFLSSNLREGHGPVVVSATMESIGGLDARLGANPSVRFLTEGQRGRPARISMPSLVELVERGSRFAAARMPHDFLECEINPLVLTPEGPVAVDALVRLGPASAPASAPARPLEKLRLLLEPRTVAIAGVSRRSNPGRIILENLLREGFDPSRIHVVKPGAETVLGCACYEDIDSLPDRVDLCVLAVDAEQTLDAVDRIVATEKAESLIVISGGLGETAGSDARVTRLESAIHASRGTEWGGPLVNGGNCLGVRSKPGRYDTLFIPDHKMPPARETVSPVALVSQSGALCVAKASALGTLNPRYLISIGNQVDLTLGDYMRYFRDDASVEVLAFYVEGFRPLDGLAWLESARAATAAGKTVILYRAGRTPAGALATSTHTASIAGDYVVTRELAEGAGVLVADSLADFEDLIRLCCLLRDKRVAGPGLGALSNAGFECVAMADRMGAFRMAEFGASTREKISSRFRDCRLDQFLSVQNPLDVSPMMHDEAFAESVRAVLEDPAVDVGVVGCVPLTAALNTLPEGSDHAEDMLAAGALATRLEQLFRDSEKAWVAVVDGGPMYDAFAQLLEFFGIPTFRTVDRALRLFERFCADRMARLRRGEDGTEPETTRGRSET